MTGLLLALSAAVCAAPARVVLRTTRGDLVVAVDAGAAPARAARFLALARSGAYDGGEVFKIDPARFIHVAARAGVAGAPEPPPEKGLRHEYGTLSFARDAARPGAPLTDFVVLLAAVPSMEGRFTAFGRIVEGNGVLEELRARPSQRVEVVRAFVAGEAAPVPPASVWASPSALLALGLLAAFAGRRSKAAASGGLLAALAGFFLLFARCAPWAAGSPLLGFALLAGAIAVFRLMGGFEPARSLSK